MSFTTSEALEACAHATLTMGVPELGESYAGKSTSLAAILTLMLGSDLDRQMALAHSQRQKLVALLEQAKPADATLQASLESILAQPDGESWKARQDALMGGLEQLHAWADTHDPALASQCLAFLADQAAADMIAMPELPMAG